MGQSKVGVIVGSLRKQAFTRRLAAGLPELAPPSLALRTIEIGDLPLYNQDLETETPPAAWTRFRQEVIASDAILFVTPEYNRSMPGALKNALDVGSRPWGHSAWNGKPAAVISLTPGALGAMAAHHHLRQVLLAVNLAAMPYPEAYIPGAASLFDEDGHLKSDDTRQFLRSFIEAFAVWVGRWQGR
jgi:chromate reductase, NAD(P)H dehydrogenase (quinone)